MMRLSATAIIHILVLTLWFTNSYAVEPPTKNKHKFINLIENSKLQYRPPSLFEAIYEHNYTYIDKFQPDQLYYQFAQKSKTTDIEIRYFIQPYLAYREKVRGTPAEEEFRYWTKAITFQLTADNHFNAELYDEIDVIKDYHADLLFRSTFKVKKEFSPHHKFCLLIAIYKKMAGEAYVFILFNDKKELDLEITSNNILNTISFKGGG